MKKLFLGLLLTIMLSIPTALSAQMRWGVTAGADISNLKWSQQYFRTTEFTSTKSLGYFAGIIGEYTIPGIGFAIDLGLQYAQRGASMNLGDFKIWSDDGYGDERSYLHYIDIPIHLRFKYSNMNGFERKLAPFVFAGPCVSILAAHNKLEAFDYKPVSFGVDAGAGVELFRKYQVSFCYSVDVTGAMKAVKLDNFHSSNRTWKVALTYLF